MFDTEEQLIEFKTAKLAKEKGFNIEQFYGYYNYNDSQLLLKNYSERHNNHKNLLCYAPTQALVQKWLRDKHGIHIEIIRSFNCYQFDVMQYDEFEDRNTGIFRGIAVWDLSSYEEALEEGLVKALNSI